MAAGPQQVHVPLPVHPVRFCISKWGPHLVLAIGEEASGWVSQKIRRGSRPYEGTTLVEKRYKIKKSKHEKLFQLNYSSPVSHSVSVF